MLERLLDLLERDETAPTTVRDRVASALDVHVADSLSGLELPAVRDAAPDRRPRRRRGLPGPRAGGRASAAPTSSLVESGRPQVRLAGARDRRAWALTQRGGRATPAPRSGRRAAARTTS